MTNKINPNAPAATIMGAPVEVKDNRLNIAIQSERANTYVNLPGLSIRATLAAMAMQGILASWQTDSAIHHEAIAEESVLMADALIEELNKEKEA